MRPELRRWCVHVHGTAHRGSRDRSRDEPPVHHQHHPRAGQLSEAGRAAPTSHPRRSARQPIDAALAARSPRSGASQLCRGASRSPSSPPATSHGAAPASSPAKSPASGRPSSQASRRWRRRRAVGAGRSSSAGGGADGGEELSHRGVSPAPPPSPRRSQAPSATGQSSRACPATPSTPCLPPNRGNSIGADAPSAPGRRNSPRPGDASLGEGVVRGKSACAACAGPADWMASVVGDLGFEDDGGLIASEPRVEHRHAREAVLRRGVVLSRAAWFRCGSWQAGCSGTGGLPGPGS